MKRFVLVILLIYLLCLSAQAQTAHEAAAADVATTGIGLALGAAEANPLGLLTLPAKLAAIQHAESLPTGEREYALSAISSIWTGAAANNLCIVAAILTGGAFAPACLIIGTAVGMQRWEAGANERLFWAICADEKTRNPNLTCKYNYAISYTNASTSVVPSTTYGGLPLSSP